MAKSKKLSPKTIRMARGEHGGPHDRGGADFWYHRPRDPHFYPNGTYNGARVEAADMTKAELAEYEAGYAAAEADGTQKDWG